MLQTVVTPIEHRCQFACQSSKLLTCTPCNQLNFFKPQRQKVNKQHKGYIALSANTYINLIVQIKSRNSKHLFKSWFRQIKKQLRFEVAFTIVEYLNYRVVNASVLPDNITLVGSVVVVSALG